MFDHNLCDDDLCAYLFNGAGVELPAKDLEKVSFEMAKDPETHGLETKSVSHDLDENSFRVGNRVSLAHNATRNQDSPGHHQVSPAYNQVRPTHLEFSVAKSAESQARRRSMESSMAQHVETSQSSFMPDVLRKESEAPQQIQLNEVEGKEEVVSLDLSSEIVVDIFLRSVQSVQDAVQVSLHSSLRCLFFIES